MRLIWTSLARAGRFARAQLTAHWTDYATEKAPWHLGIKASRQTKGGGETSKRRNVETSKRRNAPSPKPQASSLKPSFATDGHGWDREVQRHEGTECKAATSGRAGGRDEGCAMRHAPHLSGFRATCRIRCRLMAVRSWLIADLTHHRDTENAEREGMRDEP